MLAMRVKPASNQRTIITGLLPSSISFMTVSLSPSSKEILPVQALFYWDKVCPFSIGENHEKSIRKK
jgi:hypothetical protein